MFSIITPTYNRAHTLSRVFDSINSQTYKTFEWIIIDDASTDDTKELIQKWINESSFKIKYYCLAQNKGKPFALNYGFKYCDYPITIIADSDDSFIPNTLSELKTLWDIVNLTKESNKIATIWTLVKDEKNILVGDEFPHNFWQVNFKERVLLNQTPVEGEKWHSWRTEIIKSFGMNHNDNSFISESSTWNRINREYDFLLINIFHRKYYHSEDGLIQTKKKRIDIEKQKFYNSYYQLNEISSVNIIKFKFFHRYLFDYTKSKFHYKNRDLSLSFNKSTIALIIFLIYLPYRTISSFLYRKK